MSEPMTEMHNGERRRYRPSKRIKRLYRETTGSLKAFARLQLNAVSDTADGRLASDWLRLKRGAVR